MDDVKTEICNTIDSEKDELIRLSHEIHDNPEIMFEEVESEKRIAGFLKERGFEVEEGIGTLPTAFRSSAEGKGSGPNVAILAEYDALPGIGHACGHNVIATSAVGAFIGAAEVIKNFDGKVTIIGTPAEEGGGGKEILYENGAFDGVDYAIMIHPSSGKNLIGRGGRASVSVNIKFHGKAAHSSNPANGINALSAVRSTFQNIDIMRPTFKMQDNVNGIITEGGTATNVITDEASCKFSLRSETMIDIKELIAKVTLAAECAAKLTGAEMEISTGIIYAERYPNMPICEAFKANMEELGEKMEYAKPGLYGSSDIGNISLHIPAIHDYISIAPEGTQSHHPDFAAAAASPRADEVCIKAAKGLAMTAADILSDARLRDEIMEYFNDHVPEVYRNS